MTIEEKFYRYQTGNIQELYYIDKTECKMSYKVTLTCSSSWAKAAAILASPKYVLNFAAKERRLTKHIYSKLIK